MSFRIDLRTIQQFKRWFSDSTTEAAQALQKLYDEGDPSFAAKLMEYRQAIVAQEGVDAREKHDFRLTDDRVYEIWDKGDTVPVSIQFIVKKSVMNWAFAAEKDNSVVN